VLKAETNLRSEIESFAEHEDVRHALMLTYNFDGPFIEDTDRGLLEVLWRRNCTNIVVVRDGKAVRAEKRSHRYRVVNAAYSTRTFHPKLLLLLSSSEVFAAVGSANLTRGGLETNLELVNTYRLSRYSGPRRFFASMCSYLRQVLQREFSAANTPTQDAAKQIVADFDAFLTETTAARSPVEPLFLHNYAEPLLPQIERALPAKRLEALWIVSPFYEPTPDTGTSEDPRDDALDQSLLAEVFKRFQFSTKHHSLPVHIYFQATGKGDTQLPVPLLRRWKDRIELHLKNPTAVDQRTLHAKMLVLAGRTSNGKRFVTLVHGSANFTRAALLGRPPEGNAENVVLTTLFRPDDLAVRLADYLNLDQLFSKVEDWDRLHPYRLPLRQPTLAVEVLEGSISLADWKVRVSFHVSDSRVRRLVVTLWSGRAGDNAHLALGEVKPPFGECVEFELPETAFVKQDVEGKLRQLPYHRVRIEAFNEQGHSMGAGEAALNVDCPEDFCGDWLCSPEESRLENIIYRAGLGMAADYDAMRKQVERVMTAAERGSSEAVPMPSHQADLDVFFRRLHLGFRGLSQRLRQAGGSPYVCRDALRRLGQWAQAVVQADNSYSAEQRLYIADRILRAVSDCADAIRHAKRHPTAIAPIVHEEFLTRAAVMADFVGSLRRDPALGVAACNLLARWRRLQKQHQKIARP
jgi:hypothetical protein